MTSFSVPVAMAGAVTAYVGLQHLWLHVHRPSRSDLYFALSCVCMTIYDLAAALLYNTTEADQAMIWQRIQLASLLSWGMPFLLLINEQLSIKTGRLGLILLALFPVAALTTLIERSGWVLSHAALATSLSTPWGRQPIFELAAGPLQNILIGLIPIMILYCIWAGMGAIKFEGGKFTAGTQRSSPLILATSLLLMALLHDSFVGHRLLSHMYIFEYAWVGIMVVMSWSLSQEVFEAARTRVTLEDTERRVATTLNAIQDAVVTTDLAGNIIHLNPAAEKLLAVQLWDVIDKPLASFVELTSPETQSIVSDPVRFAVGRPTNPYGSLPQLVTTDGNERRVEVGGAPLKGPQGHVEGAIVILRDLTLQHNALDSLQHANKMESMGQLAGGAAHDLNNLLTPIISYVELVQRNMEKDSKHYKFLEHVQDAAQRAAGLTRQLLALSRKQVLDVQVVPLIDFVRETLPLVERLIGEKIKLDIKLDKHTGNVRIDPGQFEQVFLNLASNARDALQGHGTLRIATRSVSETECSLEFSDSGSGMDKETVEHIFEPFYTTKPRGKGTGLGLASVRGIVEQHGGAIYVDSEPGEGTSFEIILPTTNREQPLSSVRSLTPSDLARGNEHVLVAEDDPAVRALIYDALTQLGYTVHSADGMSMAVAIAQDESIDVLLTDVVLPGADGPSIRDAILKIRPIPCLFMTGHADDRLGERGFVSRGTEVLRKPFTIAQLGLRLRQVLDSPQKNNRVDTLN